MARSLPNGDLDLLVGARELRLHAPSWVAKAWGLGLSVGGAECDLSGLSAALSAWKSVVG